MEVGTTKMSSRGQIVIPQDIREEVDARAGTVFAVIADSDTIILKKVEKPTKEEIIQKLESIARDGLKRLEKNGITETDFKRIIQNARRR